MSYQLPKQDNLWRAANRHRQKIRPEELTHLDFEKVGLQFKATLENLTNLHPEGDDFRWYVRWRNRSNALKAASIRERVKQLLLIEDQLTRAPDKLKCLSCGEETKEFQYLTLESSAPLKGGRGHASMVLKCKLCGRENSIDIIPDSIQPYNADDSNHFKTMVVFDCRGVEPIEFFPKIGFAAEGEGTGTKFPEVSLTDEVWADYDEKQGESVGVYEIEHKFVTVKK